MERRIETLQSDLAFGESVRWHDGRVWYCDWVDGEVTSIGPDGGGRRVHARLTGFPICIDWSVDGTLLVVDGSQRRLLSIGEGGERSVVADLSPVSARPWNEVVAHPSGRVYVNGIGFDMMAGEAPTTGQIALVDEDGSVRPAADGLAFPNGMAITEDGSTLIVAESHTGRLTAFTIGADGSLIDRRVLAEIPGSAPDGICLTADGAVWYADVPNRRCRLVGTDGRIVETIDIDRGCFSCALSPEGVLYIAATTWDDRTFSTRRGVLLAAAPG